jgi:cystathionine beta-lyase/cystathionine gamma-synthase
MAKTRKPQIISPEKHSAQTLDLMKIEPTNPENLRPVYSNNASIMMSLHDIRIVFTEIVSTSPTGKLPDIEMRANIAMAPSQFKALVVAMNTTLTQYEAQFGAVAWPPESK